MEQMLHLCEWETECLQLGLVSYFSVDSTDDYVNKGSRSCLEIHEKQFL